MNALLLKEYMKLEMVEMPIPDIGPDDVLVRVKACGICGSDVHGIDGRTGRRVPPIVMGHEAAGQIAKTGTNVHDLQEGDNVTFDSTVYCGRCFYCSRGELNLCDNREVLGVSPGSYRGHGAFAEYVSVPRRIVYRLPDNFLFEHAALIEAVSVAVHAVRMTPVQLGDTGAVAGTGMIGDVPDKCEMDTFVHRNHRNGVTSFFFVNISTPVSALFSALGPRCDLLQTHGDRPTMVALARLHPQVKMIVRPHIAPGPKLETLAWFGQ